MPNTHKGKRKRGSLEDEAPPAKRRKRNPYEASPASFDTKTLHRGFYLLDGWYTKEQVEALQDLLACIRKTEFLEIWIENR